MSKILSDLSFSKKYVYSYDKTYCEVRAQINSALAQSGGLFDERDYVGEVDGSNFSLWINSPAMTWGVRYGTTLIGDVIESDETHTNVIIRFQSSFAFKSLAVICSVGWNYLSLSPDQSVFN